MPRVTATPRGRMPPPRRASSAKDRPSALKLMLRRQRRFARPLGAAVLLLGVVVIGYGALHGRAFGAGGSILGWRERLGGAVGLPVRTVDIDGRANTPEPLLREAIGIRVGDPIFGVSIEAARQRVESLSWVEHAVVERRLPGTIRVSLIERRPFAIWQSQGKFQLIGRDGEVVANEDVSAFAALPLVVGAGAPGRAAELLDALQGQPALAARVAAAVRVGERRWNLQLRNGITVMLPEGHATAAITRLAELQTADALLDRPIAAVDLRLPDRLVVRPLPTVATSPDATPGAGGKGSAPKPAASGAAGPSGAKAARRST